MDKLIATSLIIAQSLLSDPAFIAKEHEAAARAYCDDDAYDYHYLTPAEYEYSPGPFAYRHSPGDLPEGAVLMIGRVRVTRKASSV